MEQAADARATTAVGLALAAALVLTWVPLRFAPPIGRLLKDSGINLVTRITGLLAASIAVQLIADALQYWVRRGVS